MSGDCIGASIRTLLGLVQNYNNITTIRNTTNVYREKPDFGDVLNFIAVTRFVTIQKNKK
jgi:hypothetical protein